jgi:hypothetical protein
MASAAHSVSAKITLTEQQKSELAQTLGIDSRFVPNELAVLGLPRDSAHTMGLPDTMKAKFSPAIIVM